MTYKEFIDKLVDYVRQSGDWKVQDLIPKMVFSNKVQTMATNAHNIFINPDFAASLTMPQVVGVLWHEALHDLYDHHKVPWAVYDISSGLSPQQWHQLTNVAMDLIINDTVLAEGQELPPDGIFRDDFPYITDDMTTSHQVFKAMLKHLQEQSQNNSAQNPQRDSSNSSSSSTSNDEGEGTQSQQQIVIEISPDDPIAKAMANQAQQDTDDQAVANEPPQSPQDLDDSDDASNSSNSISEEEKNEKQSQIDKARQSIDDARNQLEDKEKKLQDRLNELNQDSTDDIKDEDDDEDNVEETDDDGQDKQEGSSDAASEKEDIENKLKELEDRRKELDEKSDELDKMQQELDSLDVSDSEDDEEEDGDSEDNNEENSGSDSEDDLTEAHDLDDSLSDDTSLSELLGDLVEEISTEVLRDLTAVDRTKRVPIPALRTSQVTWIDKIFSRVGRYLAQQSRDRTFSRPARRNPYGLPDSEYKTPQKGSLIRDYKPTVCFYLDASISMYYHDNGPEIIRKKLAQKAQLLKDTRSIVIPFSRALGRPIDVTAEFPYKLGDAFVSGTNLNNVINDINNNSFDVSVIITDATEKLYIDRIDRNRDVVIVLPNERSIVGNTSRRNIEIIQQEDLLE